MRLLLLLLLESRCHLVHIDLPRVRNKVGWSSLRVGPIIIHHVGLLGLRHAGQLLYEESSLLFDLFTGLVRRVSRLQLVRHRIYSGSAASSLGVLILLIFSHVLNTSQVEIELQAVGVHVRRCKIVVAFGAIESSHIL